MLKDKKRQKRVKAPRSCDCFGLNYTDSFYQTHTIAEVEQQWRDDIAHLKQVVAEYQKKIAERTKAEAEEKAKAEAEAKEETEAESKEKGGSRKQGRKRKQKAKSDIGTQ